jgi:hypothetical protein
MSTFAETVIVDYCLSFADLGKTNLYFPLLFAANRKFAVSVFRLQQNKGDLLFAVSSVIHLYKCVYICKYTHIYSYAAVSNGK